ncbi:hypothetical protein NQZ68_020893 [Dissostichus eleginoides]|nr:hypothetical protein NQZ68_020893 [Dissostichus eleginoides]
MILNEEQDEEDEAFVDPDSESDISDADDHMNLHKSKSKQTPGSYFRTRALEAFRHIDRFLTFTKVHYQLDRLAVLGYFPLLLLGEKNKNGYTADVFSSMQMKLDDCLEEDIKAVYAKCTSEGFRIKKEPLKIVGQIWGTHVVVEATDVVEEGDYRSNAEGQGEQEFQSHEVEVVNGGEPETTSVDEAAQGVAVSKNPDTLTLGGFNKDRSMSSKRRGKRKPQNTV